MKYIELSKDTSYGYPATCWIAVNLQATLLASVPPDPSPVLDGPQPGRIMFLGWKDEAAMLAGKAPLVTQLAVDVADISKLQTYPAMMTELITYMMSDPASPMYGGTVKDVAEDSSSGSSSIP